MTADEAAAKLNSALEAKAAARKSVLAPVHPDGIYFGLDEERYHLDLALGSSDINKLSWDPTTYWWESGYNDLEGLSEDDELPASAAKQRGSAVHVFVLHGEQEFLRRYGCAVFNGTTTEGRAESKAIAQAGKIRLRERDYLRIMKSSKMILSNDFLAKAFSGGEPEVSVFWTEGGLRRKARFDYLKPRAIVDLKSITNKKRIDFKTACVRAIAEYGYLIQAEWYREARVAMAKHATSGKIFGIHDGRWLMRVLNVPREEWAWVWCFWQADRAPVTYGLQVSPQNAELRDKARMDITRAEENFHKYMATFGPHMPWVLAEPIVELNESEMPPWWR